MAYKPHETAWIAPKDNPAHKLDYWLKTVAANIYRPTPQAIRDIAVLCRDAELRDEPRRGVWHCASIHYGTLDRCPCFPCSKERGKP